MIPEQSIVTTGNITEIVFAELKEVPTMEKASESKSNNKRGHPEVSVEIKVEPCEKDVYRVQDAILEVEVKLEPGCDSDDEIRLIFDEETKDLEKDVSNPKNIDIMESIFRNNSIKDTNLDSVVQNLETQNQKDAILKRIDDLIQKNKEIRAGECYACKTIFPTDSFLSAHIKAMLKPDVRCEKCNVPFAMECEKSIHHCQIFNSFFECHICKNTFLNEESRNEHRQKHYINSPLVQDRTSLIHSNLTNTVNSQKFKIFEDNKNSAFECYSTDGKNTNINTLLRTNDSRTEKSSVGENYIDDMIKVGSGEQKMMNVFRSSSIYRPIKVENHLLSLIKSEECIKQGKLSIETTTTVTSTGTFLASVKSENKNMDVKIEQKPIECINLYHGDDNLVIDEPVSEGESDVPKFDSWSHLLVEMPKNTKAKSTSASGREKMLICKKCGLHSTRKLYKNHSCAAVNDRSLFKEAPCVFAVDTPKCLLCSESFKNIRKYYLHFTYHGYVDNQCPYCSKIIDKKQFLRHCTVHVKANYYKHVALESYTGIDSKKSMRCARCGKQVEDIDFLNHYDTHALMYNPKSECGSIREVAEAPPERIPSHMFRVAIQALTAGKNYDRTPAVDKACMICPKKFDRYTSLKGHLIEHLYKDTSLHREANCGYKCQICKQICQDQRKYKYHMRQHAILAVYECELCDMTFCDSSNFAKHKKVHDISCTQCPMCKRKFESNKMFQIHLERHKNTEKIQCEKCTNTFYFKSEYLKHYRIRHEKVMFKCSYCNLKFPFLKNLWDHQWDDHGVRKAKVDCRECGACFRKTNSLKAHIKEVHFNKVHVGKSRKYAVAADEDSEVNVDT